MTRRNAFGPVLLVGGLVVVFLGGAPGNARAQLPGDVFLDEFFGSPGGNFPVPDGFGGYDYGGPFDGGLVWSPSWDNDEDEELDGEALFDLFFGPWDEPDDPDTYDDDGEGDDDDEDDPWNWKGERDDWERVWLGLP